MTSKQITILLHVAFWIVHYGYDTLFWNNSYNFSQLCMAVPFYINYFLLIPLLLHKNKPLLFAVWFILVWFLMIATFTSFCYLAYDDFFSPGGDKPDVVKVMALGAYLSFNYIALSTISRLLIDWMKNKQLHHELLLKKTSTQIQLVKANVSIPFILQSLTNIENRSLVIPAHAQEPVIALSNVLRYGLYDSQAKEVLLKKEIEILEDYFSLVNQNQSAFSFRLLLEGDLEEHYLPPNILVKFVGNWKDRFEKELKGEQLITVTAIPNEIKISVPLMGASATFLEMLEEKLLLSKQGHFNINALIIKGEIQLVIKSF